MAGLSPRAVYAVVRELAEAAGQDRTLAVGGARGLADALRKELGRGAATGAVRDGLGPGIAALVYVLAAPPTEEDERALKAARRRRVPIVAVLAGPELDARVPYVLATDVVRVPAGSGFPVEAIATAVAGRLGEEATALAARVPVLREPVCDALVESFARKNGLVGALVFVPGADLPVLTVNQVRLVLRLAHAHGVEVGQDRLPEVLAVVASGFAARQLARQALGAVPLAGWIVKGGVAYAATRAIGEAARRYFAAAAG